MVFQQKQGYFAFFVMTAGQLNQETGLLHEELHHHPRTVHWVFGCRFADHKSDHLPVKPFPMIDHLTAKLFPMIDHLTVKPFPMIDHRKQFEIHLSDHLPVKTMSMARLPPTVLLYL